MMAESLRWFGLRPKAALFIVALVGSGCSWFKAVELSAREDFGGTDMEAEVARSERGARESRTLSDLGAIYDRVRDYVRHEGKAPERIESLIGKYLPDIPSADTAVRGHALSSGVTYYPKSVIRDGVIDGAQLKDTGHWGYAFNDRQAVFFVDCTHANSRGRPWYQERGAN